MRIRSPTIWSTQLAWQAMATRHWITVAILVSAACSKDTSSPCAVPVITAGADSLVLLQGESRQLAPTARCGTTSTTTAFSYASSDTTAVTVSGLGVVSARAGGRVVVTISAAAASLPLPVVVYGHPAGVLDVSRPLSGGAWGVAISRAGVVFVTRYNDLSLGRFSMPGLTPSPGPAIPSSALDVAFTSSGDAAFVANYDQQQITVVDVTANAQVGVISVGGHPLRVLAHPSRPLAFATTDADSLYKIDTTSRTIIGRVGLPPTGPNSLALSPDGETLYVGNTSGYLARISVGTLAVLGTLFLIPRSLPEDIALSPNGDTLYLADSFSGGLNLHHLPDGTYLTSLPIEIPYGMRISPDSRILLITAYRGLFVIDRESFQVVTNLPVGIGRRLAFDPYGRTGVIADASGFVHLVR